MQRISLREANQYLSRYVKDVEEAGAEVVITRRGRPVARLVPFVEERELSPQRLEALERTRQRMDRGFDLGGSMPSREELHGR